MDHVMMAAVGLSDKRKALIVKLANDLEEMIGIDAGEIVSRFAGMSRDTMEELLDDLSSIMKAQA